MINLLRDQHKTVKLAAYKSLGTFIHELKGGKISQELITQYCRMVESDVTGLGKQNEVAYNCAYNFPAVLDAVRKEKWQGQLYKVYEKLLKIKDKTIKITLSESLHEIAKLLG